MWTFPDAEALLRALPPRAAADEVELALAGGRVAAETVRAATHLPRVPRSAMDGYAVRSRDAENGPLRCIGRLYAGDAPAGALGPGECIAVATGSPLPPEADAVVPRERTTGDGATVRPLRPPARGENVVVPGEEGRVGDVLVPAGARIGPRQLSALAAHGCARVTVRQPLRVALIATGDEVVEVGRPLRPEQVYESSTLALEAELRALGMAVDRFAPIPDRTADLTERFGALLTGGTHHAILTTGGVSVGDRDLVPSAWEQVGAERRFWQVAVRPGRAMYAATAGPTWIFSLSGNPHAALAAFYTLVRPALAALAGQALRDRRSARLAEACDVRHDRFRLLWAESAGAPDTLRPLTGMSVLAALTRATALLLVPPGDVPLPAGASADFIALDGAW